jgi:site-specific recombinase XerD
VHQQQEYLLVAEFLYSYRGNQTTFRAYRREIERFLHWCWQVADLSLQCVRLQDIEDFIGFYQNPPRAWMGLSHVPRFKINQGERVPNKAWRPFVATVSKADRIAGKMPHKKQYEPSQNALQATFAILSSFFNYLVQQEYMPANPVLQVRQKSKFIRKQQHQTVVRRLTELQWGYVIETATLMADEEPYPHERTLFIMNALYAMYLRISELVVSARWQPTMGDFRMDSDGHWWFTTVGKGNKERMITVSDAMLQALKRYRRYLKLSPLPALGDTTALLCKHHGQGGISSTRQVRFIVQDCFDRAVERLSLDGFLEEAEQLKTVTVHWLRHTGISEDVKHRPREHVRDDAGHGSSAITDRYVDIELRARHASARKKTINPFSE